MKRPTTEGIVIHRCEVWSGDDYHVMIDRNGFWKFLVDVDEVAFHACSYNHSTIAIAIFGDFASMEPGLNWHPTSQQIEECVHLISVCRNQFPSLKWIAGHSQLGVKGTVIPNKLVPGHTCPGENFPLDTIIKRSGLKPLCDPLKSTTLHV